MLEVKDVTKAFRSGDGTVTAVNGVTMTVAGGEFVAIVGRSGSGKTTLMSLLGALEQPTSGMIFVDGQDITRLRPGDLVRYRGRKIGFVFQSYNLVPNLTATENVMLPMEFTGVGKAERKARAAQLLEQVELTRCQTAAQAGPPERRRAAAGRDRPGSRQQAVDHPRRRARRQPRQPDQRDDHRASARPLPLRGHDRHPRQPRRHDRRPGRQGAAPRRRPAAALSAGR